MDALVVQKRQVSNEFDGMSVVTDLFKKLNGIFPAMSSTVKTNEELNMLKRQWVLAFAENGINSDVLINAGLSVARSSQLRFLPAPGEFIKWCYHATAEKLGLPTKDYLISVFKRYCAQKGYDDFDNLASESDATYWLVVDLYQASKNEGLNQSKLEERAESLLEQMTKKLIKGERLPKRSQLIEKKEINNSLSKDESLKRIARCREMIKGVVA